MSRYEQLDRFEAQSKEAWWQIHRRARIRLPSVLYFGYQTPDSYDEDGRYIGYQDFMDVRRDVGVSYEQLANMYHSLLLYFVQRDFQEFYDAVWHDVRYKPSNHSSCNKAATSYHYFIDLGILEPYSQKKVDDEHRIPNFGPKSREVLRACLDIDIPYIEDLGVAHAEIDQDFGYWIDTLTEIVPGLSQMTVDARYSMTRAHAHYLLSRGYVSKPLVRRVAEELKLTASESGTLFSLIARILLENVGQDSRIAWYLDGDGAVRGECLYDAHGKPIRSDEKDILLIQLSAFDSAYLTELLGFRFSERRARLASRLAELLQYKHDQTGSTG